MYEGKNASPFDTHYTTMGLGSSADMVKLVAINARPTILVYSPFTSSSNVEGIN
ncbi:hypothetical protein FEM48_Zijuj10G0129500 [Ziziphus jujuba var. spinosa]|uniref:Uncharacterized protein n=1 Tax=Ziziphus jujuba var. spinosa TaxID=714518 RepID=A0A978UNI3_ZIZJJ|nr:hypothetical protein FEM48_Zijuj10G0129500 [Ziziphus jujuba var. spinosa]